MVKDTRVTLGGRIALATPGTVLPHSLFWAQQLFPSLCLGQDILIFRPVDSSEGTKTNGTTASSDKSASAAGAAYVSTR